MKQIVKSLPDVNEVIALKQIENPSLDRSVFILKSNRIGEDSLLVKESQGYIFRYINGGQDVGSEFSGTNGFYSTIQKALETNLQYGKIYQCDNYKEAFRFLLN